MFCSSGWHLLRRVINSMIILKIIYLFVPAVNISFDFLLKKNPAHCPFNLCSKQQQHATFDWLYLHPFAGSGGNKPIAFMLLKLGPPSQWRVFNYSPITVGCNIQAHKVGECEKKKMWFFNVRVQMYRVACLVVGVHMVLIKEVKTQPEIYLKNYK